MKRGRVSAGRFSEEIALAIDQGVRGFVGNNVVRKACEYGLAWEIVTRIHFRRRKISKHERTQFAAVIGICFLHCVRIDPQDTVGLVPAAPSIETPTDFSAQ